MESKTLTRTPEKALVFYQISVLVLTFVAYASFHASRKPPSIVKSVLGPTPASDGPDHSGWPPFDGPQGTHRLGELDLAFLSAYSLSMFFSGHLADRLPLRLFLSAGMFLSAASTAAFGLAFFLRIHRLSFFLAVQIVSGVFQSSGWPSVVAIVGNWFGKSKRGLIMGLWNSHTSVGNIFGSLVASAALELGWGWSFVLPGIFMGFVGVLVYAFLVVRPEDAGFESLGKEIEMNGPNLNGESTGNENMGEEEEGEEEGLILSGPLKDTDPSTAIGFLEAWRLPGVAPYAFCLFFSKLVAYTFLYWLPFYIRHTAVAGEHLSHKTAGILSAIFDVGGVFGGIAAGYISDKIDARALTSILFLSFSIPALTLYRIFGSISMGTNIGLMFLSGFFVNGPYSLITTAVATDLGTQSSVKGNSRALATVTAIIDGTGSVGAALGPLLTGYISTRGWNKVFVMLIISSFLAALFLIHLAKAEIRSKMSNGKWFCNST